MPRQQSEAIILRTFHIGEQDKVVVFFSRDMGILKGIAKGARKFGNRFGSSLEPMSWVNIFYYEKERRELVTISHCDIIESFFEIQKDLRTNFTLSYFAELIEEFYPQRAQDDILFRLLVSILRALEEGGDIGSLTAYFEAWLLKMTGFLPDLSRCHKCHNDITELGWLSPKKDGALCPQCASTQKEKIGPEVTEFLRWIKKNPPSKPLPSSLSGDKVARLRKILEQMIVFHLEREPKTLAYIR